MILPRISIHSALLQYRAQIIWATPVGYLSYKVALPLGQLLFFANVGLFAGGRPTALYVAVGNALQQTAINGIYGVVMAIAGERQEGTLPLLIASPAHRIAMLLGRAAPQVVDGAVSVVLGLTLAVLLFGLDLRHADLPVLASCIVLISLSTSGLGLAFGSLGLVTRDVFVTANAVYYLLMVVCGVNFPVERLPGWLQTVSYALPLTRGVRAARAAVSGAGFDQVGSLLVGEIAIAVVYTVIGYLLFRLMERLSRRGGLQDAF